MDMKRIGYVVALGMILWLVLAGTAASQSLSNVQMSLLNQVPDPVQAGDVVDVKIRLQNVGTAEAHDINVEFVPAYPFTILEGEETVQSVAALPHWPTEESSRTLTFRLRVDRDAMIGQHSATFKKTLGDSTVGGSQEFTLEVTAKGFAEILSVDQTKLLPGRITPMIFTINNLGSAPLKNMVFSWEEPNNYVLPVGTDNSRHIKYLGPGESIQLQYNVVASVNAAPDLYELNLVLEYDLTDLTGATSTETVTTNAGVFIGGETDFDVALSDSSEDQTALTVSNVGSNAAYSVTVRIPQQQGYRVTGSANAIIGNLDKGDYTVVYFKISSLSASVGGEGGDGEFPRQRFGNASGNILKVQIDYTDTTGARQSLVKEVAMGSMSAAQSTVQPGARPAGGFDPSTFQGRMGSAPASQSVWKKPTVIIPVTILAVIVLCVAYFKKKEQVSAFIRKKLKR